MDMRYSHTCGCRVKRRELNYRCDLFLDLPCCTRPPRLSAESRLEIARAFAFLDDFAPMFHDLWASPGHRQDSVTAGLEMSHRGNTSWNDGMR